MSSEIIDDMQDKREQLYDNLINTGKVGVGELGRVEQFKTSLKDENSARKLYDNLINTGKIGEIEMGDQNAFYNSISSDFSSMSSGKTGDYLNVSSSNKKDTGHSEYLWNSPIGDAVKHVGGKDIQERMGEIDGFPQKPNESFWDGYTGDSLEKMGAGSAGFGGTMYSTADRAYGFVLKPWVDLVTGEDDPTKKTWLKEQAERSYQYADELRVRSDRYNGKGFSELWKSGDYSGAMGEVFLQASESLPESLMAMTGGGIGLALTGVSAGANKYDQLDKMPETKDLPEYAKLINVVSTGVFTVLTEKMGDVQIGKWLRGLYSKHGSDAAGKIFKNGMEDWIQKQFKSKGVLLAPIAEGIEEGTSQIAENFTDYFTGVSDELSLLDGVPEAFVYGAGGGAQFSGAGLPALAYKKINKYKTKKDYSKSRKDLWKEFPDDDISSFEKGINYMSPAEQEAMMGGVMEDPNLSDGQKKAVFNFVNKARQYRDANTPEANARDKALGLFGEMKNKKSGDIVTARDIDGQPVYVLDETNEGSLVQYKDGSKKFVSSSELSEVKAEALEDHVSAFLGKMDGGNESSEVGKRVIYNGSEARIQGVDPDGSAIIELENEGKVLRVDPSELQSKNVEVVNEQPHVGQEGVSAEMSSEVPSQDVAEEAAQAPLMKDGRPDYNTMLDSDPEMFAAEWEKRSTPDDTKKRLSGVSDKISVKMESLLKKSDESTDFNKIGEYDDEISRLKGQKEKIDAVIKNRYSEPVLDEKPAQKEQNVVAEQPVFSNDEENARWVGENSEDVNEILGTYDAVRGIRNDRINNIPIWQQELIGKKIKPDSFYENGDRNNATSELKRGWLSKEGRSIDELAHDLSNHGVEVGNQDIVDFMMNHPSGNVRQSGEELDALGRRFSDVASKMTGMKIGRPDSPTGKLFIEKLKTAENAEQLKQQIESAQQAETEVLRSMAEQNEAEKGGKSYEPLTEDEISNIIAEMKDRAEDAPVVELTPENWLKEFGADGMVDTPVGRVKMGDNQYLKLLQHERGKQFGMVRPTLENPDVVVEDFEGDFDGSGERASSFVFVKTFNKDGERYRFFTSVTVRIEGLEVSISSHIKRENRIKDLLRKGKLQYRVYGDPQIEHSQPNVSATISQTDDAGVSANKDTEVSGEKQEDEFKNGDDGLKNTGESVHLQNNTENNGRDKISESVSQGEHGAEASEARRIEECANQLRRRIEAASGDASQREGEGSLSEKEINRMVESEAKEYGLWIPMSDLSDLGSPFLSGNENNNYLDVENGTVYKMNNLMNSGSLRDLFARMDLHNTFFPETKCSLSGFTGFGNGGAVYPIYKQRFIPSTGFATSEEIDGYMRSLGFEQTGEAAYSNGEVRISDLRPRNVLKDTDGDIYVIDADFKKVPVAPVRGKDVQRVRIHHFDGKDYTGDVVKEDHGRVTIKDDVTGRNISVPDKNVQERLEPTLEEQAEIDAAIKDIRGEQEEYGDDGEIRYRKVESPKEVNERFNRELDELTEENADRVILSCGMPEHILLSVGIPDRKIALYGNKLLKKAKLHGYSVSDIKNLPDFIQHPIAVFKGGYDGSFAILAEMMINDKNTLVSIDVKKGEIQDLNLITSVFDKNSKGVVDWINKGKLLYADKEKALDYLSSSAPIADATNNTELSSATNIVQNFENPSVEVGENSSIIDAAQKAGAYLKAPNGKDTNLTPKQWVQVRTKAFKDWFGDWENDSSNASKVVDGNGEPMVVYHGTGDGFTKFSVKKTATPQFWFTDRKDLIDNGMVGAARSGVVMPVFLNIKKPAGWKEEDDLTQMQIMDRGFDGKDLPDDDIKTFVAFKPNQIKSTTDNVGTFSKGSDDIRYRNENAPEEVNERFNRELRHQIDGKLPKGHVYQLGKPSGVLRSAGIPDLPIELAASRLNDKSQQDNHPFNLSEVSNLPDAIYNPLAVFRSATHLGSFVVMTEIEHNGKNFVVAIEANRQRGRIEVNSIRSIHYRTSNTHMANWIEEGLLEYADKKRMSEWLSKQRYNSADVKQLLGRATNILQNFENPTVLEGEISAEVDNMSAELGVKIEKIKDRKDLPDGIQRQMKGGRYPGLYDPKSGKVYVVMNEIADVSDMQATILHEVVGHKGIHGLFGDRLPDFCDRVLASMKKSEREEWIGKYDGNEQLAAEEYVASFAEGYTDPSSWEKVKAIVKNVLRDMGIDLQLSDNDLMYILWKAKNGLKSDDFVTDVMHKTVRDRRVQDVLFRKMPKELMDSEDFITQKQTVAQQGREKFVDSAESVKSLIDFLKKRGAKINDFEDAYSEALLTASKSHHAMNRYREKYQVPLNDAVAGFVSQGKTFKDIYDYLIAKHAPERNREISNRDFQEWVDEKERELLLEHKKYEALESGSSKRKGIEDKISKIKSEIDIKTKEHGKVPVGIHSGMSDAEASHIVESFEGSSQKGEIDNLWKCVNAATNFTIERQFKDGLISKELYDRIKGMYRYYVPLRGWEESDGVDYSSSERYYMPTSSKMKRAEGRKTRADNPIAYIEMNAETAINRGNRNYVNRCLYNMCALSHFE